MANETFKKMENLPKTDKVAYKLIKLKNKSVRKSGSHNGWTYM